MCGKQFESVWDSISTTPTEAESMKLRSIFMRALKDYIESENLSQSEAANLLDVAQSDISDLARGKIHSFSLDALVNMLATADCMQKFRSPRGIRIERRFS